MTSHEVKCEHCGALSAMSEEVVRARLAARKLSCIRCGGALMFPRAITVEGMTPLREGAQPDTVVYFVVPDAPLRAALNAQQAAERANPDRTGKTFARRAYLFFTFVVAIPTVGLLGVLVGRDAMTSGGALAAGVVTVVAAVALAAVALAEPKPRLIGIAGMTVALSGLVAVMRLSLADMHPEAQAAFERRLEEKVRQPGPQFVELSDGEVVDARASFDEVAAGGGRLRRASLDPALMAGATAPVAPGRALPDVPTARCCAALEGTWVLSDAACGYEFPQALSDRIGRAFARDEPVGPITGVSQRRTRWAMTSLRGLGRERVEKSVDQRAREIEAEIGLSSLPERLAPSRTAVDVRDAQIHAMEWNPAEVLEVEACMREHGGDKDSVKAVMPLVRDALAQVPPEDETQVPIDEHLDALMRHRGAVCCGMSGGTVREEGCEGGDDARMDRCFARIPEAPHVPPMPREEMMAVRLQPPWLTPTVAYLFDGKRAAAVDLRGGSADWRGMKALPVTVQRVDPLRIRAQLRDRVMVGCLAGPEPVRELDTATEERCRDDASSASEQLTKMKGVLNDMADLFSRCCWLSKLPPGSSSEWYSQRTPPCVGRTCPTITCDTRNPAALDRCLAEH